MSQWLRVCRTNECPPGSSGEFVVARRMIALFHVADGTWHALDGVCPHQGGPLGKGLLHGCIVTCPWHGWQFDVRDGQHQISAQLRHPSFPVKIEENEVFVCVDGNDVTAAGLS